MKQKSITKIIILVILVITVAVVIFLLKIDLTKPQYERYVNTEMGFEIDYPIGITPGTPSSSNRSVWFRGKMKRRWKLLGGDKEGVRDCDKYKYWLDMEVITGFVKDLNVKDLDYYFDLKKGIKEKIPIDDKNTLLISEVGPVYSSCRGVDYTASTVNDKGEYYVIRISAFEARYDLYYLIRPIFESFKLIN